MNNSSRRKFLKSAALTGLSIPIISKSFSNESENQKLIKQENDKDELEEGYLETIKQNLKTQWPKNRTINLVFHGHSVPAGYFKTPEVNTLHAYPYLLLKELKMFYPYAVINIIVTSIGGENSIKGADRFKKEVLCHKPDVLFIDYALNDQQIGLSNSMEAWDYMIKLALKKNIKVVLLTASPDQRVDIMDENTELQKICDQIKLLAKKYKTGLVDSYAAFQNIQIGGEKISDYMSQVNHPNEKGHQMITDRIMKYF